MPDSQGVLFKYDRVERLSRMAEISECGRYRWWLRRSWTHGGDGRVVCFVMLNPSTADALIDDPTVRRCMDFARRWGFTALSVRNLFAFRATEPKELSSVDDPTGGHRGDVELWMAGTAHLTVAAWGAKVPFRRDREALEMFKDITLYCLGTTKNGHPRHPLYVRKDQPLKVFPNRMLPRPQH